MIDLATQAREVCSAYGNLNYSIGDDDVVKFTGIVRLDNEIKSVYLVRDFPITVLATSAFPAEVPRVLLPPEEIPEGYEHLMDDGSLCLGTRAEIVFKMQRNSSLLEFFNEVVLSNLFAIEYFDKYRTIPNGERSHGLSGIIEAYKEIFGLDDLLAICRVLDVVVKGKYKGHLPCPCGSGLKSRDCHGDIILTAIKGPARKAFEDDFKLIARVWTIAEKRENNKAQLNQLIKSSVRRHYDI